MTAYGLYLHIPFCQQKCFYCDFPSFAGQQRYINDYITAAKQEIKIRQHLLLPGDIADTIYIGGGTPTLLAEEELQELIAAVCQAFALADNAEFTVEANPGTVDADKLKALVQLGVNRISFGVQSFSDKLLKAIGRIHTAELAGKAVAMARKSGFANINIDLMYGLPHQTLADLQASILKAVALEANHISVYGLQVESGTVFAALQAQQKLLLPDAALEDDMYEYIMAKLPALGYERYEISNFAKPNYQSKHNLKYWQNKPYIGIGAAAHSCYSNKRWANVSNLQEYLLAWQNGNDSRYITEELDEAKLMEEFCFLGLRMQAGISIKLFEENFNRNIFSVYGDIINRFSKQNLLKISADRIYLTKRGMKYANQIFCEFLQ